MAIKVLQQFRQLGAEPRNAFIACFLGWTLDAFDFFLLTFCFGPIAAEFHVKRPAVVLAITLTLACRPFGALFFGWLADRYGRRPVLMANILCFTIIELASAFAPTMSSFLVLRALFGVAMGGEWGIGAALCLETLPAEGRGFFSGLLQEGYACGYLLAAIANGFILDRFGWRGMFIAGAIPALLVLYIRAHVKESPTWQAARAAKKIAVTDALHPPLGQVILQRMNVVWAHMSRFIFMTLMMVCFMSFSHGTQDLYPDYLKTDLHFATGTVSWIVVLYTLGMFAGGMSFGAISERIGRRRAIATSALLAIPMIPLWAFSHAPWMVAAGAFLMQFMVQGAWGVVPAHLNELSPASVRATLPGVAYQLGALLTASNAQVQTWLCIRYFNGNYSMVFAGTVIIGASALAIITMLGKEAHGADFSKA